MQGGAPPRVVAELTQEGGHQRLLELEREALAARASFARHAEYQNAQRRALAANRAAPDEPPDEGPDAQQATDTADTADWVSAERASSALLQEMHWYLQCWRHI